MSEKSYQRKYEIQSKIVSKQSEQIALLKSDIEKLKLELEKKDRIINSITPLKDEMTQKVNEVEEYKEEYKKLINELRKMKEIINQTVYKGRWRLVKFLIK